MNPFFVIALSIAAVAAFLLVFSMAFTWVILKASDRHMNKMLKKYASTITDLMPGKNCGKCGYGSCKECATAIAHSQESPDACKEGDDHLTEKIFACMVDFQKSTERPQEPEHRRSRFFHDDP